MQMITSPWTFLHRFHVRVFYFCKLQGLHYVKLYEIYLEVLTVMLYSCKIIEQLHRLLSQFDFICFIGCCFWSWQSIWEGSSLRTVREVLCLLLLLLVIFIFHATFNIFHQLKPQLCQDEIVSPSVAVNATYMVDQPLNGGSPDCGCTSLAYIIVWLSSF